MISKISRCYGCNKNILDLYNKQREYNPRKMKERENKDIYKNAILISIFDQSYSYISVLNNYLYLEKDNIIYKVDVSTCSIERIAEVIEFLKDK